MRNKNHNPIMHIKCSRDQQTCYTNIIDSGIHRTPTPKKSQSTHKKTQSDTNTLNSIRRKTKGYINLNKSHNTSKLKREKGKAAVPKKGKGTGREDVFSPKSGPRIHSLISRPPARPDAQTKTKTISRLGYAGALTPPTSDPNGCLGVWFNAVAVRSLNPHMSMGCLHQSYRVFTASWFNDFACWDRTRAGATNRWVALDRNACLHSHPSANT